MENGNHSLRSNHCFIPLFHAPEQAREIAADLEANQMFCSGGMRTRMQPLNHGSISRSPLVVNTLLF
jgi:hypothetical protein